MFIIYIGLSKAIFDCESIVLYQRNFCKPHFTVISTAFQEPFSLQKEHEIDTIKRLYFQTMHPLGATV